MRERKRYGEREKGRDIFRECGEKKEIGRETGWEIDMERENRGLSEKEKEIWIEKIEERK